jgi:putative ABC transport system permease protein
VADVRSNRYNEELQPTFFRPYHELSGGGDPIQAVVRTALDLAAVTPALRRELAALEPNLRAPTIWSAQQMLYDATLPRRVYRNYLATFAGAGLLLAALGIYGVLSYAVAQRTNEIGIRMALGATSRDVMRAVGGRGLGATLTGLAAGVVLAAIAARSMSALLYGFRPDYLATVAVVSAILVAVAALACVVPARRAARIDPITALRQE